MQTDGRKRKIKRKRKRGRAGGTAPRLDVRYTNSLTADSCPLIALIPSISRAKR